MNNEQRVKSYTSEVDLEVEGPNHLFSAITLKNYILGLLKLNLLLIMHL